jgi:hypothetical protein
MYKSVKQLEQNLLFKGLGGLREWCREGEDFKYPFDYFRADQEPFQKASILGP